MQGQENSRKSAGGLTATALKWAALAAMTLDHAAWMFLPAEEYPAASFFLHLIGRAAFPVFAFLAAQGAKHTSCLLRYAGPAAPIRPRFRCPGLFRVWRRTAQ